MRPYGPASASDTRLQRALHDAIGRAVNQSLLPADIDFGAVLLWCQTFIDTEIAPDEHTCAPVNCARDAVRAYAKEHFPKRRP